jgi:hypothetical protein
MLYKKLWLCLMMMGLGWTRPDIYEIKEELDKIAI